MAVSSTAVYKHIICIPSQLHRACRHSSVFFVPPKLSQAMVNSLRLNENFWHPPGRSRLAYLTSLPISFHFMLWHETWVLQSILICFAPDWFLCCDYHCNNSKLISEPKWVSLDSQVEFGRIQTLLYPTVSLSWGSWPGMQHLAVLHRFHAP